MGDDLGLGRSVDLFLQLEYPEDIPSSDLVPDALEDVPHTFMPFGNRVGHCFFRLPGEGQKVLRRVQLRSYCFYILFSKSEDSRKEQHSFRSAFLRAAQEVQQLRPSLSSVDIKCNGLGAWTSFRGSQTTQFVFKTD